MSAAARKSLVAVGIISIVCAVLGLLYNFSNLAVSFSGAFRKLIEEERLVYFYSSFYVMSALCITCYVLLIFCGIQFMRYRVQYMWLFISVLIFEVIYSFSIGFFVWLMPALGHSVAAATGLANGGLMFQFFILFPLWGSILVFWSGQKLRSTI